MGGKDKRSVHQVTLLKGIDRNQFIKCFGRLDPKNVLDTNSVIRPGTRISCAPHVSIIARVTRQMHTDMSAFIADKFYNISSYREDGTGYGTQRLRLILSTQQSYNTSLKQELFSRNPDLISSPTINYWVRLIHPSKLIPLEIVLYGRLNDVLAFYETDHFMTLNSNSQNASVSPKLAQHIKLVIRHNSFL